MRQVWMVPRQRDPRAMAQSQSISGAIAAGRRSRILVRTMPENDVGLDAVMESATRPRRSDRARRPDVRGIHDGPQDRCPPARLDPKSGTASL